MKQWDDLRLFLAVAKNGTLTGAADELESNVATLHRRLKSFEEGFGISLFEKGPRGYRLTNAGEALLSHTNCLLYTSPSPRDQRGSRMPSSA